MFLGSDNHVIATWLSLETVFKLPISSALQVTYSILT